MRARVQLYKKADQTAGNMLKPLDGHAVTSIDQLNWWQTLPKRLSLFVGY